MADRSYDINVNVNSPVMQGAMGAAPAGGIAAPMPPGVMQAHARAAQQLHEDIKRRIPPLDNLFKTMGIEVGLKSLLKQSQIFTSTVGSLFQMFGAMVDVILAPFAKYIVFGIQKFAEWIPKIGKFAEWLDRNVVSHFVDFMKKVWNWMLYPGDWLPLGGMGMPKSGDKKGSIFDIEKVKEAEGWKATLLAVITEGVGAAVKVGVPILWGTGALALLVGALALIGKIPAMAGWFAKSALNIFTKPVRWGAGALGWDLSKLQTEGGLLGKPRPKEMSQADLIDEVVKVFREGGDVAGGVPPRPPIPQAQLDRLDNLLKLYGVDEYEKLIGEITPEVFKKLDAEVQETLIRISENFTNPPFSKIPDEVGKNTSKIATIFEALFTGGAKFKGKGGLIGIVVAGVAGIIAAARLLFKGGPTDEALGLGADAARVSSYPTPHGGRGIHYEDAAVGRSTGNVDDVARVVRPSSNLGMGTIHYEDAAAWIYKSNLMSAERKLALEAAEDLKAGGFTKVAAELIAMIRNPSSAYEDELVRGAVSDYNYARQAGMTYAAKGRFGASWLLRGNLWIDEMIQGSQLALKDIGFENVPGMPSAVMKDFRLAQTSGKAAKLGRFGRGGMPIAGAIAQTWWQFSQWQNQKEAQNKERDEWDRLKAMEDAGGFGFPGPVGPRPGGHTYDPTSDFGAFVSSLGVDAGNLAGLILGVPTTFMGTKIGLAGAGLAEILSGGMNMAVGEDFKEGTLLDLFDHLNKAIDENLTKEERAAMKDYPGFGYGPNSLRSWSDLYNAAGGINSADSIANWSQNTEAYARNQTSITIHMVDGDEREVWGYEVGTGSTDSIQVQGDDWETIWMTNQEGVVKEYRARVQSGVVFYKPWTWGGNK